MPAEEWDDALGASYRLVERLGRGSTGEVWRAVDRRTDEVVAAKLLRSEHVEDEDLVERFLRERAILTKLRHPAIVSVRDLVVEGDRLAIVMEYVDGGSLRDAVPAGRPLPPALALGVSAAVLDGLAAAHDQRVLHRDIKPDNVLLSGRWRELAPDAVKVSDFGIARIVADRGTTSTGLVGTPEYMAPEQLLTGDGGLPADVYGAGVLLYELLAGRTPFAGAGTGYTVAHRHVTSLLPPLPLPDPVWDLVTTLLDKDPAVRPTARDAAAQVRALVAEVVDLDPLPAQELPAHFASAGGPPTEVRGLVAPPEEKAADREAAERKAPEAPPLPDLGTGSSQTMLRAMPVRPVAPTAAASADPPERERRPIWRDRRAIALAVAGLLLIGGGIVWVTQHGSSATVAAAPPTAVARALQQSEAKASGLGISREAVWDAAAGTVRLTTTYSAELADLRGPFLEVVPGLAGSVGCPDVAWQAARGKLNPSFSTGIDVPCAWSVSPTPTAVPARGSAQVAATVRLPLPSTGADDALQKWLDSVGAATDAATTDSQVTSTSYPAQRLTEIQVVAPSRTVSGKLLRISLVPVWPSGADALHPLYQSPSSGDPSSMLVAVAGGTSGVRFSDQCSNALSISGHNLVVTALAVADSCQVGARVGNFTDLLSNEFAISTRGS